MFRFCPDACIIRGTRGCPWPFQKPWRGFVSRPRKCPHSAGLVVVWCKLTGVARRDAEGTAERGKRLRGCRRRCYRLAICLSSKFVCVDAGVPCCVGRHCVDANFQTLRDIDLLGPFLATALSNRGCSLPNIAGIASGTSPPSRRWNRSKTCVGSTIPLRCPPRCGGYTITRA